MAKAGKRAPKDELAMSQDGTPSAAQRSELSVDGVVTSSNRKVRISTGSPGPASKGSPVRGRRAASGSKTNGKTGQVTTEVFDEDEVNGSKKFSPKHKDSKVKPEKSLLKTSNGSSKGKAASKKRKASDVDEDEDVDTENIDNEPHAESSTSASTSKAADNADEGEIDFLAGFESGSDEDDDEDGQDSSDEEQDGQVVTAKELPEPKSSGKAVATKSGKKDKKSTPGVIYLGRIPHGFHEDEMRSYFTQFGTVIRLRLARNKKTGSSRHYAFIEFEHDSVAQIVSETMDNYLLHGHILQCKVVPSDEIHPKMWIGANKTFRPVPKGRIERMKHNAPKTQEQKDSIANRLVKRESKKRRKLRELGIEYDFDGYVKTLPEKQEEDKKHEKEAREAAKKLEMQVEKDQKQVMAQASSPATAVKANKAKKGGTQQTATSSKKSKKGKA